MSVGIAAVVVASRGARRLERSLASVAWAEERIVLDPAGRVGAEALPPGVRLSGEDPGASSGSPWLLLLHEGEVAPPALAAAIGAAVGTPPAKAAFRVPLEIVAFGATLQPRGAPVRLARRPTSLRHGTGLAAELTAAPPTGQLAVPLVARVNDSLAGAVGDLDADAAALAALLRARRVRVSLARVLLGALATAGRLGLARGAGDRWARWSAAVLGGYRVLVTYAKLWELARAEPTLASLAKMAPTTDR